MCPDHTVAAAKRDGFVGRPLKDAPLRTRKYVAFLLLKLVGGFGTDPRFLGVQQRPTVLQHRLDVAALFSTPQLHLLRRRR